MAIEQLLQFLSGGLQGYQREKNSQYQRELMKQDRLLRAQQAKDQADWRDYTSRETNRHNLAMEGVAQDRAGAYGEGQDALTAYRNMQARMGPYNTFGRFAGNMDPTGQQQFAGQLGINAPGVVRNPAMDNAWSARTKYELGLISNLPPEKQRPLWEHFRNQRAMEGGPDLPEIGDGLAQPPAQAMLPYNIAKAKAEVPKINALTDESKVRGKWISESTVPRINAINAKIENDAKRLQILGFSARSMDDYRNAQAAAIKSRMDFQTQVQQFRTAREARLSNQALVGMGDRVRKAQGSVAFMRRMALDQYMKYDLSKMPPEDAARIRDEYTYQSRLIDDIEAGVNQDAAELAGMEEWYRQNAKPGAPPPGGASGPQYTNPAQFGNFAPHPGGTINSSLQAGLPLAPGASPVPLAPPPATRRGTPTPKPPVIKSNAAKRAGVGVKTRPVGASGKPKSLKSMSMDQLVKEVGAARADLKKR